MKLGILGLKMGALTYVHLMLVNVGDNWHSGRYIPRYLECVCVCVSACMCCFPDVGVLIKIA